MKKITALLICVSILSLFSGCGQTQTAEDKNTQQTETNSINQAQNVNIQPDYAETLAKQEEIMKQQEENNKKSIQEMNDFQINMPKPPTKEYCEKQVNPAFKQICFDSLAASGT